MRANQCDQCQECYFSAEGRFCMSKNKLISKIPKCAVWTEIKKKNAIKRKNES